jgi:hypothetical protein
MPDDDLMIMVLQVASVFDGLLAYRNGVKGAIFTQVGVEAVAALQ